MSRMSLKCAFILNPVSQYFDLWRRSGLIARFLKESVGDILAARMLF